MTESNPQNTPARAFVITRIFDAPRDLVFDAFTQREHLMNWFGPKGFKMLSTTLDLRTGGVFHYGMQAPDGSTVWGKWIFREIVRPERLVAVVSFSDAAGGVTRHPYSASWPLETLSTTSFAEQGGKTVMTLKWEAINATGEERKTFDSSHEGMKTGWGGTLDQLEHYLAKVQP
jgi:uncharacterized protein YndB with AHSA1/START domain